MAEDVRRQRFCDADFVGDPFHYSLNRPRGPRKLIVQHKKVFEERFYPPRHRDDSDLGFFSVRPALAVDADRSLLPLDLLFIEGGELRYSKSGLQQSIDAKFFLQSVSYGKEAVCLLDAQWLTFVLVCHGFFVVVDLKVGGAGGPETAVGCPKMSERRSSAKLSGAGGVDGRGGSCDMTLSIFFRNAESMLGESTAQCRGLK